LLGGLDKLQNMLRRTWSRAPDRAKSGLPGYFHTSPRLDPVRVIAKAAASVEWKLYSKKDLRANGDAADPIDDHELYELLENPCPTFPELDGWTLRYLTFAHRRLVGEFFWLKVRADDRRGTIVSLLPVPAAWVPKKPTVGDHTYLVYPYGVTASKALMVFPQDIVWFKDPDLSDPYGNGRGSIEAIADDIETDEYAAKYQKNYFHNDGMPPFIVSGDGISETGAKQIKATLLERVAGWMHAKEPAVIGGKDIKVTKLGDSAREIDMIESRKFLRDSTLQHNQVPPELYGIIENSNRATIDSAFYLFNKNVITYDLASYERTVNNQLVSVDYGADTVLKHDKVIQEDEEFALQVYSAGASSGMVTRNEWRTRFRLPELPAAVGNVFVAPMGIVATPADEPPEPKPEPAAPVGTPAPSEPDPDEDVLELDDEEPEENDDDDLAIVDENDEGQVDNGKAATAATKKSAATEARRAAVWKTFDAKASSGEPLFTRAMKTIATAQREKVKAAVKTAITTNQDEAVITAALKTIFTPDEDTRVKHNLAPAWAEMMKIGNAHAIEVLGTGKSYHVKEEMGGIVGSAPTVVNDWFNTWIEEHGLEKAKGINETTSKALHDRLVSVISDSVENGESIGKIVKALLGACDGVYDDMDGTRAARIARTETACAMNFGSYATYKTEGVGKKEWLATQDDRTRDEHADADGQVVPIDDPFDVGGNALQYPGDPDGDADEVVNCRCSLNPIVGDDE
jgi:HK97 family phage portal protein